MPGKARRVAARQSQLNRRRRKQQRGPSGTPPVVAAQVHVDDPTSGEVAVQPEQTRAPVPASMPATPAAAQPGPASPPRSARVRGERPDAYTYVGPEIRRILSMAGVAVVALLVLGVLL